MHRKNDEDYLQSLGQMYAQPADATGRLTDEDVPHEQNMAFRICSIYPGFNPVDEVYLSDRQAACTLLKNPLTHFVLLEEEDQQQGSLGIQALACKQPMRRTGVCWAWPLGQFKLQGSEYHTMPWTAQRHVTGSPNKALLHAALLELDAHGLDIPCSYAR